VFLIVNDDGPGEGFNDPTPVMPVAGNPGLTLGRQRLELFRAAADTWGRTLDSPVVVRVLSRMDRLPCSPLSGTLGIAAPLTFARDFPNAPRPATWYPIALANSLAGVDLLPEEGDLIALFNRSMDDDPECFTGLRWWYGIGAPAPRGTVPLFPVVLHELAHGLGFTTLVERETGERALGFDDTYMLHLEDHSTGLGWSEMTDSERVASSTDIGDLHWVGPRVVAGSGVLLAGRHPSGHVQMYAPNPPEPGSSVSHWDTALAPDELMEPFLTLDATNLLTTQLLEDLGWPLRTEPDAPCTADATTLCIDDQPGDGRFEVRVEFQTELGGGASGPGRAIPLTSLGVRRGGLFWFFSPTNPEMLVKVINGCTVNGHYWVFYSAGTNVGLTVAVTDTVSGRSFVAVNPDRTPVLPVQEVEAFACQ
jgi:hypothetical protein